MTPEAISELAFHANPALCDAIDRTCGEAQTNVSAVIASLTITLANVIGQLDDNPSIEEKLALAALAGSLLISYTQYVHEQTTPATSTRN